MHYLRNQNARVVWRDASSQYVLIEKGVSQGAILSPFLFKLYIDCIIEEIASLDIGCMLGITRINVLVYADDIVLMVASLEEMGALYQRLCNYTKSHELTINKLKTKCMIFGTTKKTILENGNVKLENDEIEVVKTYKYLGHVIQGDMGVILIYN